MWDGIVYDSRLNLLFIGTGNGSPWNRQYRGDGGGDNLYIASIIAVNPDTGQYVWHYQETPGDEWDYDATSPLMLADLKIDGQCATRASCRPPRTACTTCWMRRPAR